MKSFSKYGVLKYAIVWLNLFAVTDRSLLSHIYQTVLGRVNERRLNLTNGGAALWLRFTHRENGDVSTMVWSAAHRETWIVPRLEHRSLLRRRMV